jgi:catecholate siderophore receptor
LTLAIAAPIAGHAQSTDTEQVLRPVNVQTTAEAPYKADAVASPKFTQPLKDTPQTIQVITSDLFKQQGATTLTEALRNSPGVGTFFVGENGSTSTGDSIYMRGFDTSSSIFVDGIRDLGSISRDLFNIDQVEVEKGPAGTDNGRSAPTGAINMVSKQAFLHDQSSGTIDVGTGGQKRATADMNQTLKGLNGGALRLNAMWQDSDQPGRDHVNNSRVGFAPSLGLGLEGNTRAYINLLYIKQDNIPDGGVPTIGLPGWTPQPGLEQLAGHPVDQENFYGTRNQDHDDVTAKMATLKIEHDFSDTVKLSNIARWGQTAQDYLLTSFMGTGGTSANPQNGNIKWTDINDLSTYTIARSNTNYKDQVNKILTDQLNLRVDFTTGSIPHNLSTGLEWAREQQDAYTDVAYSGSRPAANLYDPNWNDVDTLAYGRNGAGSEGQTDTASVYAFDTAKFGEHFLVTGGVRLDHYKTEYNSTAACTTTTPLPRGGTACPAGVANNSIVTTTDLDTSDTLFNWKLGAVYKPVEAGSLYVNYAISWQPPGGANFQLSTANNNANNPDLDPQKAKTLEVGTKWDVLQDALALNLAWFRTDVTNEINTQDVDLNGNPSQSGKKRVQGFEISAVGSITENWAVSTGYTHLNTSVENGPDVAQDGSSNLTYTPDSAFTAWTTYRLPFGLTVGGGAIYSGEMHRGTDGAVGTPAFTRSYTVYNALVSYPLTENLTLRMNAYNLFDKEYVAAINKSGYRYTPGTPRTFLFSTDFRF